MTEKDRRLAAAKERASGDSRARVARAPTRRRALVALALAGLVHSGKALAQASAVGEAAGASGTSGDPTSPGAPAPGATDAAPAPAGTDSSAAPVVPAPSAPEPSAATAAPAPEAAAPVKAKEPTPPATPPASADSDKSDSKPLTTGTVRLLEHFYEGGIGYGFNGPLAAEGMDGSIGLTSVRVAENYGNLARLTVGMLVAMGQSDSAYVGSTYGYNYRIDYYRPLTDAERAAQAEQLSDALSGNYVMDLAVYTSGLFGAHSGKAKGKGFEFYLGGMTDLGTVNDLPAVLQITGGMSYLLAHGVPFKAGEGPNSDAAQAQGMMGVPASIHHETVSYMNFGVMLRAIVPINRYLEGMAQWDANILSLFDTGGKRLKSDGQLWTSPLRVGASVNATDRIFLRGNVSLNGFGSYGFGSYADAGVRF
ncbi:MAG: hypothetical protein SFV15_26820 [Polyangiaceae bacterium]|nr:hypothetical protein [Polyangiaceae bacterium]